jgi:WD40 repeat protein
MRVKHPAVRVLAAAVASVVGGVDLRSQATFPPPASILYDAKHKEPKSGVQKQGNTIVIQQGVGTPTTINVIAFSRDAKLLVAGKDFGRVVIWDVAQRAVVRAIETNQGIVRAVAISPDNQFIATAGSTGESEIKLWRLADAKLVSRFEVGHPAVQRLLFARDGALLVAENNSVTYVLETASGSRIKDLPGEWAPTLSADGLSLMTVSPSEILIRSVGDWSEKRRFPKPTMYAYPLSFDVSSDSFIYGDSTKDISFFAVRLGTGDPLSKPGTAKLPKLNMSTGYFASFDPKSGVVFGHSEGRLWLWDFQAGKICASEILYSESGALSPDGSLLAGAIDNSFFAGNKVQPGIGLWPTDKLRAACGVL